MLMNTFCHLPGIGEKTERKLWAAGVTSRDSSPHEALLWLPLSSEEWSRYMREWVHQYEQRNAAYFAENLPTNQRWRLYWDFRDECAFVDIETTGLPPWGDEITTIVLYDGRTLRHYVNGDNLDQFPKDVEAYPLLVTYNGKTFDIPFLERFFRIRLPQAHIDLRYPLRSLGLKGGLKGCERQLGISRPGLENVGGFDAVLLWQEYRTQKNIKALETLLAYNIQDTLALHALMVHTHNEKVKATPFAGSYSLPAPSLPASPFKADSETLERLCPQALTLGPFSLVPPGIVTNPRHGIRKTVTEAATGTLPVDPPAARASFHVASGGQQANANLGTDTASSTGTRT